MVTVLTEKLDRIQAELAIVIKQNEVKLRKKIFVMLVLLSFLIKKNEHVVKIC